jgi:hypothetical protein
MSTSPANKVKLKAVCLYCFIRDLQHNL